MDGPIASAVIVPDELAVPASPVNGQKRRQESVSEDSGKRPRLDQDAPVNERRNSIKDTKPAPVRREKGRERRLFGAVLGALSQNTTTTAQRRRNDVEKRQLAQRKQDAQESEQRKAERAALRKEQRWREQKHYERQLPWETSRDEEERIQIQIAEAEDAIKRDLDEYEAREQPDNQRRRDTSEGLSRNAEGSHTSKNHNADAPQETSTTNGGTNGSATSPKDLDMKDHNPDAPGIAEEHAPTHPQHDKVASNEAVADQPMKVDDDDENGEDVVEEAAEDTLIY
ncbi:pinin/SDK/memA domain containing protein [Pyrenophora tritici-repentis Pt-1C-BFP]|uniref:Pinin/SDK/memA domain containing protein n=1 Tax=Pyrenophora tritici-repentis (strain Pt-1C-BFP) TaxID=426418 RepID=B2WHB6_PYRTR|nr:pinin/SDK/memA domain containing protein [Pyrenophora tritici-repentis Pt-1C-BFP]EDU42426.1 pinin/SDK/memA domain containing protein [Pyrenophora tritici-repentis Pt-1C-BFP]